MTRIIDNFRGPYRWLSNFELVEITMPDGITYPSSEHAFQAQKSLDLKVRENIAKLSSCRAAKKAGNNVTLRDDWEEVKLEVMEEVVRLKFEQHPFLRGKLLRTGSAELVEGNTWGDSFWGVYQGEGENHLGKILMKVRSKIQRLTPAFFKVLDVSTGHITESDGIKLGDGECPLPNFPNEYGCIVYCEPSLPASDRTDLSDMSEAFARVMAWAEEVEADYVWFDRDGTTYGHLEIFEW